MCIGDPSIPVTERTLAFFLNAACILLFGCTVIYLCALLLVVVCLWFIAVAYNAAMDIPAPVER